MNNSSKKSVQIPTSTCCKPINGTNTEIFCANYEDRIFILVTQYGKFGSWYDIRREALSWDSKEKEEEVPLSTDLLFGKDDPIFHIHAKHIARVIYKDTDITKPILLSIAIKEKAAENLHLIADMIQENKVW